MTDKREKLIEKLVGVRALPWKASEIIEKTPNAREILGDTTKILDERGGSLLLGLLFHNFSNSYTQWLLEGVQDWDTVLPWPTGDIRALEAVIICNDIFSDNDLPNKINEWTVAAIEQAKKNRGESLSYDFSWGFAQYYARQGAEKVAKSYTDHHTIFRKYLTENPAILKRLTDQGIDLSFWQKELAYKDIINGLRVAPTRKDRPPIEVPAPSGAIVGAETIERYRTTRVIQADLDAKLSSFVARCAFDEAAKAKGLNTKSNRNHMVFTGGAGTGKTTLANVMGNFLKSIGMLEKGHVVHTTGTDLIEKYVGHTAAKVRKKCEEAFGGVLFIDEIYHLLEDEAFGPDAINELLAQMENNRGKFILVIAGYEEEVMNFIHSNPGLKDRFGHFFDFSDFSGGELSRILDINLKMRGMSIEEDARIALLDHMEVRRKKDGRSYANARTLEVLLDKVVDAHAVAWYKSRVSNINLKITRANVKSGIAAMPALRNGGRKMGFSTDHDGPSGTG